VTALMSPKPNHHGRLNCVDWSPLPIGDDASAHRDPQSVTPGARRSSPCLCSAAGAVGVDYYHNSNDLNSGPVAHRP
jgi:hypothetical protein